MSSRSDRWRKEEEYTSSRSDRWRKEEEYMSSRSDRWRKGEYIFDHASRSDRYFSSRGAYIAIQHAFNQHPRATSAGYLDAECASDGSGFGSPGSSL